MGTVFVRHILLTINVSRTYIMTLDKAARITAVIRISVNSFFL